MLPVYTFRVELTAHRDLTPDDLEQLAEELRDMLDAAIDGTAGDPERLIANAIESADAYR